MSLRIAGCKKTRRDTGQSGLLAIEPVGELAVFQLGQLTTCARFEGVVDVGGKPTALGLVLLERALGCESGILDGAGATRAYPLARLALEVGGSSMLVAAVVMAGAPGQGPRTWSVPAPWLWGRSLQHPRPVYLPYEFGRLSFTTKGAARGRIAPPQPHLGQCRPLRAAFTVGEQQCSGWMRSVHSGPWCTPVMLGPIKTLWRAAARRLRHFCARPPVRSVPARRFACMRVYRVGMPPSREAMRGRQGDATMILHRCLRGRRRLDAPLECCA